MIAKAKETNRDGHKDMGPALSAGSRSWPECPRCGSQNIWRNGFNSAQKQQWRCRTCGRIFVIDPYIPGEIKLIADRMLAKKWPVPEIATVLKGFVSRRWLYDRRSSRA